MRLLGVSVHSHSGGSAKLEYIVAKLLLADHVPLAGVRTGPRSTDWLAKGVVKQHRTIATYLNILLRLGFNLTHVEEWGPSDEQIRAQPSLADERHRPPFLIVAAKKP